ncbi:hypothetical protein [Actinoplanes aureus]|uniref:Protein kinase domain-containing protein n=1 Tax=Actinoplanes aureus TaxID=2792083 RepID=A0A931FVJ1_9ACTN|nr:hypothetical protein [Actinoplanes aureus]MBG0560847.1 hypothetical protein [Actinoplanes aureus]
MDAAHGPGIDTPAGYTRLQRTGTGAGADVYRAWDERAGRWAVLRLFHRYLGGRAEEAAFAAYCAATVQLGRNPSIVPVRYGGITATGRPWLALDLVDGRTLAEAEPPSPAESLHLVIILADALAWAHSMRPPIAHGRLRPEHILLDASGAPLLTEFAAPIGTSAPAPGDDVVQLTLLLFHLLTGHVWPGGDDREISIWPGLSLLVDQALAPIPQVDTMAEFAVRLREVRRAAGVPQPAAPEAPPVVPPDTELPHRKIVRRGWAALLARTIFRTDSGLRD